MTFLAFVALIFHNDARGVLSSGIGLLVPLANQRLRGHVGVIQLRYPYRMRCMYTATLTCFQIKHMYLSWVLILPLAVEYELLIEVHHVGGNRSLGRVRGIPGYQLRALQRGQVNLVQLSELIVANGLVRPASK